MIEKDELLRKLTERLDDDRLREATERGWLGEVDGLKVSLDAANQKLAHMRKIRAQTPPLGLPAPRFRPPTSE